MYIGTERNLKDRTNSYNRMANKKVLLSCINDPCYCLDSSKLYVADRFTCKFPLKNPTQKK